jgi:hypothetical protein
VPWRGRESFKKEIEMDLERLFELVSVKGRRRESL